MLNKEYSSLLLDQSNDLIWMVDGDFLLTYANQAYLNLMKHVTGKEKKLQELILVEGFGEGYIEKWTGYYKKALSGEYFELEEHYSHPETNAIQYGQIIFNPIRDDSQQVIAVACQSRDITRIVKQRSEAHQLMDASLEVFCSINEAGNFVYVSEAATKHWGYSPQELIGKPYVSFTIEEDIPKTNDISNAILNGEEIKSFVNRYNRKDGAIAYNLWSARWDSEAKLMYCVARDAKEKIEQETLLLKSEQRFKALVQEGADLIAILDINGIYRYVSPTSFTILGMQPEEFLGRSPFEFIHPDDAERIMASLEKITEDQKVQVEPFRFKNSKNEWRWIETVLTNMLNNPAIQGIVANSRDITAKKEEEHRLKLLESVITNTNDAILITEAEPFDEPGPRILYVNEAFTRLTGYTAEEVIGKTPRILQGPNSDKAELDRMGKALRNWEPCEITTINYKKNGDEFWINFSITPVTDERGWYTHWIAIERDVTENKKIELSNNLTSKISSIFNLEPDLYSTLIKICEEVSIFGQFSFCEIWLTDIQESLLELKAVHKNDDAATIFYERSKLNKVVERGQGTHGKIWENSESIIWEHKGKNQELLFRSEAAEVAAIKNIGGFPLKYHDQFIGVLQFGTQAITKNVEWIITVLEELGAFIGAEIARKKIEIELAQIFEFAPDLIITAGFDGYIKRINPAGLALLGYSLEEMKSRPIISFIHEQDRLLTRDKQLKLYSGEGLRNFENRYITKEGKIVWLSWTSTSLPDQGIVYAVAKNITEEKSLRELNRLVGELAKIGSWEVDVVNQTVFWSDEVHQIYGTDAQSFVPNVEAAIKFYREDFRELALSSFENCIVTQEPYAIEAVIVNRSNKEVWVRTTAKAEFIDGVCTRIYGSFQDIDELKTTEILKNSLLITLEKSLNEIYVFDAETLKFSYVNQGALNNIGYSEQEIKELTPLDLEPEFTATTFNHLTNPLVNKEKEKIVYFSNHKRKNGTLYPVEIHLQFVVEGNNKRFLAVILDITHLKETEQLLDSASKLALVGSWEIVPQDIDEFKVFWSSMTKNILEIDESFEPTIANGINFYKEPGRTLMAAAVNKAIETGEAFDLELELVTGKGNDIWVRCIGDAQFENGKVTRVFGSFQDINTRKVAELNQLKLNEEKSTILESISDYFYALDGDLNFTYMNSSCANFLAVKKEKIIGKNLFTEFPQLKNTQLEDELRKVQNTAEASKFEFYYAPFDTWFEESIYPTPVGISLYFVDITQRKKAEAARIMAEKNYQELFDKSNDAIYVHDIDTGQLIDVNYRATELTGFDKIDLLEKDPSILFTDNPEYSMEKAIGYLQKAAQGDPQVFEWLGKKKYGASCWFEMTLKRTSIAGVDRILAFQRDITERKQSEEKLIESEQKYRQLSIQLQLQQIHLTSAQEVAKVGSWETDLSNLKLTWSDETYRIFGMDRESFETTHESFLNYVHPDDREKVNKALIDSTQTDAQTQNRIQHRIMTASGESKVVEEHWKVTFGDKGEPLLAIGSCQDITERKKAEKELVEERRLLRAIIDNIPVNVYVKDNAFKKILSNKTDVQFAGFQDEKSVLGKTDFDLFNSETAQNSYEQDFQVLQSKESIIGLETQLVKNDGTESWLLVSKIPLLDEKEEVTGLVGVSVDITERRKSQQLLIESERTLSSILNSLDEVVWAISLPDSKLVLLSNSIDKVFGKSSKIWKRKFLLWKEVILHEDKWIGERIEKEIKTQGQSYGIFRIKDVHGHIKWLENTVKVIRNEQDEPVMIIGTSTDITEKKNVEDALTSAQELAEETNRSKAELELRALQMQMNPHFIFNALNSIQSYIFDQDTLTANHYLTKFSRLIRLFLDSSRSKFIPLSEEINLLTLYIELERIRFDNKFEFEIVLEGHVNKNIEIPTMILQPFIENAINHGLRYKQEKGLLSIRFQKEQNYLICTIEDDGVGRKNSAIIKDKPIEGYKSQGLKITAERLVTYNKINDANIVFSIKDRIEHPNSPSEDIGTVIEIRFPEF